MLPGAEVKGHMHAIVLKCELTLVNAVAYHKAS